MSEPEQDELVLALLRRLFKPTRPGGYDGGKSLYVDDVAYPLLRFAAQCGLTRYVRGCGTRPSETLVALLVTVFDRHFETPCYLYCERAVPLSEVHELLRTYHRLWKLHALREVVSQ